MVNVFHTNKYINDYTFKALDMKGNKRNNFEKVAERETLAKF